MDEFFHYWFKGLEKGIEELSEPAKTSLFEQCGIACSDSYTRSLYGEVWDSTKDISSFFQQLNNEIQQIGVREISKEREYEITYNACLCDLYTKGYMTKGCLCECSRQSLLYNLTSLWPDKLIDVQLIDSILRGGNQCILYIHITEYPIHRNK